MCNDGLIILFRYLMSYLGYTYYSIALHILLALPGPSVESWYGIVLRKQIVRVQSPPPLLRDLEQDL